MKKIITVFMLGVMITTFSFAVVKTETAISQVVTKEAQQRIKPEEILSILKQGNKRFQENKVHDYNHDALREEKSKGQHPLAFILSCVDSRSVPDVVFDQPFGTLFVGRVAGNVVDSNMLGSIQFATENAGAKVIVVMGHTSCGAVQGACAAKGKAQTDLEKLLAQITPAVKIAFKNKALNCKDRASVDAIAKQNVIDQVNMVYERLPHVKSSVDQQKMMLLGAMHDLSTGKVTFFYQK